MHRARFLTILLCLAIPSYAQTPRWIELAPPPFQGAAAFDSAGSRMLLLGGPDDATGPGTVWSLHLPDLNWKDLVPTGTPPDVAPNSVLFDPVVNRLVVFVGGAAPAVRALDLIANPPSWALLATSGTPPDARSGYSVVYDPPRRRMLVFGGYVTGTVSQVFSNKVWALTLDGTPTWSELAVPGTLPLGRRYHTAVYDPSGDRMIVFGGGLPAPMGETRLVDEAWALSLAGTPAWTFLTPVTSHPTARSGHAAVVDPAGHRMIVYGGSGQNSVTPFADGWSLDLTASTTTATWSQVSNYEGPGARSGPEAIWDVPRSRMVLYGGSGADVWSLGLDPLPTWSALTPNVDPPPAVFDYAAVIDSAGDRMVLHGGSYQNTQSSKTWIRSLATTDGWIRSDDIGPGARSLAVAVADPAGDRMLHFSGNQSPNDPNDLWAYGFTSDDWQLLPGPAPPGRNSAFGAFDVSRRKLLVYGGASYDWNANHNVWFDDTWVYDAVAGTWQELTGAGTLGHRWSMPGIYDPVRDRFVTFGGRDSVTAFNDLHALSLGGTATWIPLAPIGTPPPATFGASAVYDPDGDRMLVFEIANLGLEHSGVKAWALSLSDPMTWSVLTPDGRMPAPQYALQGVMDAKRGRVLFHGLGEGVNQTWAFYLDRTTPVRLALVDAAIRSSVVRLRWYSADALSGAIAVLRRVDASDWASIGTAFRDGSGMIVYDDRDFAAGQLLDYKLRVNGEDFGMVTVSIPGSAGTLRLSASNPSFGAPRVAVELANGPAARLELYDVTGRRVLEREVESTSVLTLARQSPGVYFLRLIQGTNEVRKKIAIAG